MARDTDTSKYHYNARRAGVGLEKLDTLFLKMDTLLGQSWLKAWRRATTEHLQQNLKKLTKISGK